MKKKHPELQVDDFGARKKTKRTPALQQTISEYVYFGKTLHLTSYNVLVDGKLLGKVTKTHAEQWCAQIGDLTLGVRALRRDAVDLVIYRYFPGGLK